jgi:hypothetical protein
MHGAEADVFTSLFTAIPRQSEEPQLWHCDRPQLRQGCALHCVTRDHGARNGSQHGVTGQFQFPPGFVQLMSDRAILGRNTETWLGRPGNNEGCSGANQASRTLLL